MFTGHSHGDCVLPPHPQMCMNRSRLWVPQPAHDLRLSSARASPGVVTLSAWTPRASARITDGTPSRHDEQALRTVSLPGSAGHIVGARPSSTDSRRRQYVAPTGRSEGYISIVEGSGCFAHLLAHGPARPGSGSIVSGEPLYVHVSFMRWQGGDDFQAAAHLGPVERGTQRQSDPCWDRVVVDGEHFGWSDQYAVFCGGGGVAV